MANQRRFIRGFKNPEDREETKNIKSHQRIRAQLCSQSSTPLVEPIVACELGNLFSKEVILEAILDKKLNESFSHIRGLKDLKTLRFTSNPAFNEESDGEETSRFICPVTQIEFNGIIPFVFVWTTGFVLSEKSLKEIGVEGLQAEFGPFTLQDIVKLIPTEEELPQAREMMHLRRARADEKKKEAGKRKRDKGEAAALSSEAISAGAVGDEGEATERRAVESDPVAKALPSASEKKSSKSGHAKVSAIPHAAASAAGGGSVGPSTTKLSAASKLAEQAQQVVKKQKESSTGVFKTLFHDDKSSDKVDRDLFMSVAGFRYNLS